MNTIPYPSALAIGVLTLLARKYKSLKVMSVSETCRHFNVGRKSAYALARQLEETGLDKALAKTAGAKPNGYIHNLDDANYVIREESKILRVAERSLTNTKIANAILEMIRTRPKDSENKQRRAEWRLSVVRTSQALKGEEGLSFEDFARKMGIHPRSLRRWRADYKRNGLEGLLPGSTRPKRTSEIEEEIVGKVEGYWKATKGAYPITEFAKHFNRKYRRLLQRHGRISLSRKKITDILVEAGLYEPSRTKRKKSRHQFMMLFPGAQWIADTTMIIFHLLWFTFKFKLITVKDAVSGAILAQKMFFRENAGNIVYLLEKAVRSFGVPIALLVDNGKAYISHAVDRFCNKHSVLRIAAAPYRAQTKSVLEGYFAILKNALYTTFLNHIRITLLGICSFICRKVHHGTECIRKFYDRVVEKAHGALRYVLKMVVYLTLKPFTNFGFQIYYNEKPKDVLDGLSPSEVISYEPTTEERLHAREVLGNFYKESEARIQRRRKKQQEPRDILARKILGMCQEINPHGIWSSQIPLMDELMARWRNETQLSEEAIQREIDTAIRHVVWRRSQYHGGDPIYSFKYFRPVLEEKLEKIKSAEARDAAVSMAQQQQTRLVQRQAEEIQHEIAQMHRNPEKFIAEDMELLSVLMQQGQHLGIRMARSQLTRSVRAMEEQDDATRRRTILRVKRRILKGKERPYQGQMLAPEDLHRWQINDLLVSYGTRKRAVEILEETARSLG